MSRSPPASLIDDKELEELGIIPRCIAKSKRGSALAVPCKLQYLGFSQENGKTRITLSDGTNFILVAVLEMYSVIFTKGKVTPNQLLNLMNLAQRGGELTLMAFRVIPGSLNKLGSPSPL